ncbi:hypothetical protein OSB04_010357 [Centaurea solstitialis]|uniref:Glucan endo-1,3-beta-D-glucosidase n=1 Tax=Centaurea solstitialis TaxID=347529 RepID=A0AA38TS82_9ASTR|nr:hypothetical protein OSB04_010357 [Centaurea solstitialis]
MADFTTTTTHLRRSSAILLLLLHLVVLVSSIGINYGQVANNLPPPEKVVPLVKSIGANKVKLYDADPKVLKAFAGTGIEFIVGLGNEYLSKMQDLDAAQSWVKCNVQIYLPATKITSIAVGNEVLTYDTPVSDCLLPAMQNIHTALVNLKLDGQITVTTAHSLAVLETSYPPSAGAFKGDLIGRLKPILDFLSESCSPFLINAYPFFAYKANPKQVSLDYVLFQSNDGIVDSGSNLHYDNMLFAQIDAVYAPGFFRLQDSSGSDIGNRVAVKGRRRRGRSVAGKCQEVQRKPIETGQSEERNSGNAEFPFGYLHFRIV